MQKIIVLGLVIFAAFFLFRKAGSALNGRKKGCSGCGCKDKSDS